MTAKFEYRQCYSHPTAQGYRLCERFFAGDTIQPDAMPNVKVDVAFTLNPLAPPAPTQPT